MAGKKQALGKGLDALFGDIGAKAPVMTGTEANAEGIPAGGPSGKGNAVLDIDIDEIKPNPGQPRKFFDEDASDELVASIEEHGVLTPILLRKAETGYELVYGERRWRAARKAGLKTIPATIREVTDEQLELFAIIENTQREDLNTIEEAMAYQTVIQKTGMTQEMLAKTVGKSRSHIANTLRTLQMQNEIVELLRDGKLTLGHANALGAVKNSGQQLGLAKKIVKNGLSVREAERLAALIEKKPLTKERPNARPVEIRVVEQELTSATGIRVKIKGNGDKGSVELSYFDRQGLEEIIDLLRNARTK